jgi:hypothetical protein
MLYRRLREPYIPSFPTIATPGLGSANVTPARAFSRKGLSPMSEKQQFGVRCKRAWKKAQLAARNLPLTLTSMAVLTCVELFTAGGIIQTTTESVTIFGHVIALALLEIGISYGSGILSMIGFGAAAELAADPRPEQRARARNARFVSVALLVVPIIFFTNALAVQVQRSQRLEYIASERYEMHRAAALGQCIELAPGEDCYVDSDTQRRAQTELRLADEVKTARIDGAWFAAFFASVFVYGVLGWANTAFYKPKPETPWEARERADRERREDNRRRRREKEQMQFAMLQAEMKRAQRPSWFRGIFGKAA